MHAYTCTCVHVHLSECYGGHSVSCGVWNMGLLTGYVVFMLLSIGAYCPKLNVTMAVLQYVSQCIHIYMYSVHIYI